MRGPSSWTPTDSRAEVLGCKVPEAALGEIGRKPGWKRPLIGFRGKSFGTSVTPVKHFCVTD